MSKDCDMDCLNCKFPDCIREPVCSEKNRYCNRTEQAKQADRERQKKKYEDAKAKKLCVVCKKRSATHGVLCLDCWYRKKRYDKKRNSNKRERWIAEGKCYFCGKDPIKGKNVCAAHYQIFKKRAEYMLRLPQTKEAQHKFAQWYWKLRGDKNDKH